MASDNVLMDINWSEPFEMATTTDSATEEFAVPEDCLRCLQKSFGHTHFRKSQWKIIASILDNKRDNIVIMTTGYGKSLCYQFPSVYRDTITIVVSPLISLMQDQVTAMRFYKLRACFLGSAQTSRTIVNEIIDRRYNVVYVTPEYITAECGTYLLEMIRDNLTLIAIDEAHCISKWGHDFRPAYRGLSQLRSICPEVPILAMTATATAQVREDICQSLGLYNPQIVATSFDRPNLQFIIKRKTDIWADIGPFIQNIKIGSVIIYCISRRNTEELASVIEQHGIQCGTYHAGFSLKHRQQTHDDFLHDRIRIVVATVAFGMGINKPDVRLVIHYGVTKDVESYYQEVGRAGRDGLPATCIMFHQERDWSTHRYIREHKGLQTSNEQMEKLMQAMRQYVDTIQCRRRYILSYFGENCNQLPVRPDCCDNCRRNNPINLCDKYHGISKEGLLDITDESFKMLTLVQDMEGKYGLKRAILVLKGSTSKSTPFGFGKHTLFGSLQNKSERWLLAVGNSLLHLEMLIIIPAPQRNKFPMSTYKKSHSTCTITSNGKIWLSSVTREPIKVVPGEEFIQLLKPKVLSTTKVLPIKYQSLSSEATASSSQAIGSSILTCTGFSEIYRPLLKVRSKLASLFDVMPYLVASTMALQQLAKIQPTTMEELRKIGLDGYSEEKIERFGPVFLKVIREYHVKIGKHTFPMEAIVTSPSQTPVKVEARLNHTSSVEATVTSSSQVPGKIEPTTEPANYTSMVETTAPSPNQRTIQSTTGATIIPYFINLNGDAHRQIHSNSNADLVKKENDDIKKLSQESVEIIESTPPPLIEIDSDDESVIFISESESDNDNTKVPNSPFTRMEVEPHIIDFDPSDNENHDLDLLIDAALNLDIVIEKPVSNGLEHTSRSETFSDSDIFDEDWDMDLTHASQQAEQELLKCNQLSPPDIPSSLGSISQNTTNDQRVRKPRIIKRRTSHLFEYEDDSSSDSENDNKSIVSPKKRILPSWMQLSTKTKR